MDYEVQRAMAVIKRAGPIAVQEMLEHFPVLRHSTVARRGFNLGDYALRAQIEREDEWQRWTKEIPLITFPDGWHIQMRPPTVGAIVRFNANGISVYLDCYSRLGLFGEPYWEIYPAEGGDVERFAMTDVDGLVDGLRRAIEL